MGASKAANDLFSAEKAKCVSDFTTQPTFSVLVNCRLPALRTMLLYVLVTGGPVNGKLMEACLPPPDCSQASPLRWVSSQGTWMSMPLYWASKVPPLAVALMEAKLTEPSPNAAEKGPVESLPHRPLSITPQSVTVGCNELVETRSMV